MYEVWGTDKHNKMKRYRALIKDHTTAQMSLKAFAANHPGIRFFLVITP